jgi:hypothetical protein
VSREARSRATRCRALAPALQLARTSKEMGQGDVMASLPDATAHYRDSALAEDDPKLGHALERVVDAGQTLIVRRMDLLVEELSSLGTHLLASLVNTVLGGVLALVGWLITVTGVIDALDDRFARHWVEIAIGVLHIGIGAALLLWRRRLAKAVS